MSPLEPSNPQAEELPTQLMTVRLDHVWLIIAGFEEGVEQT